VEEEEEQRAAKKIIIIITSSNSKAATTLRQRFPQRACSGTRMKRWQRTRVSNYGNSNSKNKYFSNNGTINIFNKISTPQRLG
jgi:hypothetical protein